MAERDPALSRELALRQVARLEIRNELRPPRPILLGHSVLRGERRSISRVAQPRHTSIPGRLHNNLAELELRREKLGAKNWLYCGSDDGAHWNAVVVSLVASCQFHGIEPWAYLSDVLTLLPSWPAKRVLALAPKNWNETRQQPQTQQLLVSLRLLGRNDASHAPEATATA